jgi:hypothetical protein
MSVEPAELLIDAVGEAATLAEAVERHLDAFPLPVDDASVARIADRLHRRMQPRVRFAALGAGLLAATMLASVSGGWLAPRQALVVSSNAPAELLVESRESATVKQIDQPGTVIFAGASRSLDLLPGAAVLASEQGRTAVVLVQRGLARDGDVAIPEGHWAALTRTDAGEATVVFRDGDRPPRELEGGVWQADQVTHQLRDLRWRALPDRTLDTLDRLLEEP